MSTPSDPQGGTGQPAGGEGAGAQPAYYRPAPSGHYPQYPQNPYGPGRSGSPPPQFSQYGSYQGSTYPYGGPFPAGTGPHSGPGVVPPARPRSMATGLALLLVPPALFLLIGLFLVLTPLTPAMFPPEAGLEAALAQSGLTMDQLLSALRTFGAVMAVLAVLYAVLAVVSFLGKLGALITLTVLTVLFDLFWLLALLSTMANPVGAILPVLVLGTSVAGVWLMFSASARAWFAGRR